MKYERQALEDAKRFKIERPNANYKVNIPARERKLAKLEAEAAVQLRELNAQEEAQQEATASTSGPTENEAQRPLDGFQFTFTVPNA